MHLAFIGTGQVGAPLAARLTEAGHAVVLAESKEGSATVAAPKKPVGKLIADCAFEPGNVGGLVRALHLEPMPLLWVRMVRAEGHSPHLVGAALRR